ncbi:hypothetical protein EDD86DRAFT_208331 [Gorgonomyces haynaldii]|nr:hypothetical protein EDD86DRAFT_208331 [Gorgonomyces haynaldii]
MRSSICTFQMPPKKGGNSKAQAANDKKAANEAAKKQKENQLKEQQEEEQWSKGAKDNASKREQEQKKLKQQQEKLERERLLQEEEASIKTKKTSKQPVKRGLNLGQLEGTESYGATGVDNALELLSLTNNKTNDQLDRHPERRMKAAYAKFEQERMPTLKQENPSLRLTQLQQLLIKEWKKSPDNPMNQAHVEYNTSKEEAKSALDQTKAKRLDQFKQ